MKDCRCINNTPWELKMQIYNVLDLNGCYTTPGQKIYSIKFPGEGIVKISDFEKQRNRASNAVQMHIFINGTIRMELSPTFFKNYETLIFEMDGDNPVVKGIVRRKHETQSQGSHINRIIGTLSCRRAADNTEDVIVSPVVLSGIRIIRKDQLPDQAMMDLEV